MKKSASESIVITGSLAYDHIMTFPDHFKDHILPDKIPTLSVSFHVDTLNRNFGGTAGNIAYTMRLLGMHPIVIATAGNDFEPYQRWLHDNTIATDHIKVYSTVATAQAFIITDRDDSQITAFHPGSMNHAHECTLSDLASAPSLVVISPNGIEGMRKLVKECKGQKIPYLFDPGQSIPMLDSSDLKDGIIHAKIVTVNEYEMELITQATEMTIDDIQDHVETLIVTHGARGSTIYEQGTQHKIPIAYAQQMVDPTGCGDAHRAGLLFGLEHKLSWEVTGRIGALAATYCAEKQGTQNHFFEWEEFKARYKKEFGDALNV